MWYHGSIRAYNDKRIAKQTVSLSNQSIGGIVVSEQNFQGTGMNQGEMQGSGQMPNVQMPQDDPYAAYRQWDQSSAYQPYQQAYPQTQQAYPQTQPAYPAYTPYVQGNESGGYQIPPQTYPNQQVPQTFQGQYVDYSATTGSQNIYHSGPVRVPQVSMATGEQVLYNAPMAPSDQQSGQILVPQMSREGLSESPKIHVGNPGGKKRVLIACTAVILLIAAGVVAYFMLFAGKTAYTAEDVVAALYRHGLPIDSPLVYTEATDPEGLLGTMNQYTSKVSWFDRRVTNGTDTVGQGGIVEVFPDADMAQERLRQLNLMLPSQAGAASQVNRVVMRLSTKLSSSQIAEYQDALKKMFGK